MLTGRSKLTSVRSAKRWRRPLEELEGRPKRFARSRRRRVRRSHSPYSSCTRARSTAALVRQAVERFRVVRLGGFVGGEQRVRRCEKSDAHWLPTSLRARRTDRGRRCSREVTTAHRGFDEQGKPEMETATVSWTSIRGNDRALLHTDRC